MAEPSNCVFCKTPATLHGAADTDGYQWRCPQCGTYVMSGTAQSGIGANPIARAGTVSGWIRQQNAIGIIPEIDSKQATRLRVLQKPPFKVRAERYLTAAVAKCQKLNDDFQPNALDLIGASFSDDVGEVEVVCRNFTLTPPLDPVACRLLPGSNHSISG